ncbi:amidohydrolase family protein [Maribellus sediminis]|uniref:amidohydrolase family protein n=1 Tax=Maribellus sediminis TaxID=2696285 RepID=UPI00143218C7|nr:amidohydrolase family protein [Maribellus sediminis]
MRKFAATYLFTGQGKPVRNSILICDDDGTILDVEHRDETFREEAGVEYYSGILVPGFVNAHCHLELSHLHGKISEKQGIAGFVGEINRLRNAGEDEEEKAMQVADRRMWANGIAAVGDISNSDASLAIKQKSKIKYHTFVEVFGFHPSRAKRAFDKAVQVQSAYHTNNLQASIVPHSAYSVSDSLFLSVSEQAEKDYGILSIHNQESEAENEFVKNGTGPIADHFQHNLKLDLSHWKGTGNGSLQRILSLVPKENKLLLVHNTFTNKQDIEQLVANRSLDNTWFVLCPNSNLYIENALPPVSLFRESGLNICLGTDSLASNHQLSILEEMITLQQHFETLKLEELLSWACINGAFALDLDAELGSFEVGKKPGVNLISGLDLKNLKLTQNTKVKRLL